MTATILRKELRLALVPPAILFNLTALMLLIPAYPFLVVFFYGLLGVFFVCIFGRENHDVEYTALLPVTRNDIVRARFLLCTGLELTLTALCLILAAVRPVIGLYGNESGMDPGPVFFGTGLLLMGVFNVIFFPMYYRNTNKVGVPFLVASVVYAAGTVLAEAAAFITTIDTAPALMQFSVLAAGAAAYVFLTWAAYRMSARFFQRMNLTS